jgi:putative two-component system response regulator
MKKLIFIVDDNDSNLTLLSSIVENTSNVLTMSTAQKMFSLLAKRKPHLIFLDIEMPDMGGFETLQKLRENPEWAEIPVIMVTGWYTEEVKQRAVEMGAKNVIAKPFSVQHILDSVETALSEVSC